MAFKPSPCKGLAEQTLHIFSEEEEQGQAAFGENVDLTVNVGFAFDK